MCVGLEVEVFEAAAEDTCLGAVYLRGLYVAAFPTIIEISCTLVPLNDGKVS